MPCVCLCVHFNCHFHPVFIPFHVYNQLFFEPSLFGKKDALSPDKALYKTIMESDVELRKHFYNNIVMSGGSTMFAGLQSRIQKEMYALAPPGTKVHVVAYPHRLYSSFVGGSILASLSSFMEEWITKEEFDDVGPRIVHRKCLR